MPKREWHRYTTGSKKEEGSFIFTTDALAEDQYGYTAVVLNEYFEEFITKIVRQTLHSPGEMSQAHQDN